MPQLALIISVTRGAFVKNTDSVGQGGAPKSVFYESTLGAFDAEPGWKPLN